VVLIKLITKFSVVSREMKISLRLSRTEKSIFSTWTILRTEIENPSAFLKIFSIKGLIV
jgi:hypothetical protein